jgi:hypothetical protein
VRPILSVCVYGLVSGSGCDRVNVSVGWTEHRPPQIRPKKKSRIWNLSDKSNKRKYQRANGKMREGGRET